MSFVVLAGIISTLLAIYSAVPYISSVIRGRTQPHQLGWLVLTIMNGMVFFAQIFDGARASALVALAFLLYSLTVFVLSFSRGVRSATRTDKILFFFAVLAMIAWAITRDNAVAIWLTLFIDLAATIMIILKVKNHPGSEDATSWVYGTLAYVFSCLTLINIKPGILYVRPVYGLVCDAVIVVSIVIYNSKPAQTKH